MKNIKLEAPLGSDIEKAVVLARQMAEINKKNVEFNFNGIRTIISENTVTKDILRDYFAAFSMKWKSIGPDCPEWSEETTEKFDRIQKERQIKMEEDRKVREEKRWKTKTEILTKISGTEMLFSNKNLWDKTVEKNGQSEYGAAIIAYAEMWARLMQVAMNEGQELAHVQASLSEKADIFGLSGAQYSFAVRLLYECWKFGPQLKDIHNGAKTNL